MAVVGIGSWFTERVIDADKSDGGWHYRFEEVAALLLLTAVATFGFVIVRMIWLELKQIGFAIRGRKRR